MILETGNPGFKHGWIIYSCKAKKSSSHDLTNSWRYHVSECKMILIFIKRKFLVNCKRHYILFFLIMAIVIVIPYYECVNLFVVRNCFEDFKICQWMSTRFLHILPLSKQIILFCVLNQHNKITSERRCYRKFITYL